MEVYHDNEKVNAILQTSAKEFEYIGRKDDVYLFRLKKLSGRYSNGIEYNVDVILEIKYRFFSTIEREVICSKVDVLMKNVTPLLKILKTIGVSSKL